MNDPVRDEIDFHIDERTRELIEQGLEPEAARREAEAAFGDVRGIGREVGRLQRQRERRARFTVLAESLRAALVATVRQPRYAGLVAGTLGIGIGATVAMFSLIDAVLLDPLPFERPDELVRVFESDAERPERNPAPADFFDLRNDVAGFSSVAAAVVLEGNLLGDGLPERVRYADVSANYFHTLGVQPELGRRFGPEAPDPGARAAVISHELWNQRWGADPAIMGRTIDLDGRRFELVGVAPRGFAYPASVDLWTTAGWDVPASHFFGADAPTVRDAWYHTVIARLAPDVSIEVGNDQVSALAASLRALHPETFGVDAEMWLVPLQADQVGDLRTPLLLLLGATTLVLLIVSANVANLALVRATARRKEWALRLALGSSGHRLAALVLSESLCLALAGGALGVVIAATAVGTAAPLLEPMLPATTEVSLDPTVLTFALLVSLATAVAFGLAPALAAARVRAGSGIAGAAGRRHGGAGDRRTRDMLVSAEVALAVVLVLGAGLLLRSLASARSTEMGFAIEGLTTMEVGLPGVAALTPEAQVAYYETLGERVDAVRGVEASAWGQFGPAEVGAGAGLRIQGRVGDGPEISVRWHAVSTGYFETVGIPLITGRTFSASDRSETERVAVVNETLARRFFPDEPAVGQLVNTGLDGRTGDDWNWVRIVGVAADVRNLGPERPVEPMIYRPRSQHLPGILSADGAVLHLRASAEPPLAEVRAAVRSVNPDAPIDGVLTGHAIVAEYFATRSLVLGLLGLFAGVALFLGALGIYGLTRFAVQQRAREIGVRMAIGADRSSVVGLIVRQGLTPTAVGLATGLGLALAASRTFESRLFGVRALDPLTWGSVLALLAVVSLVASWLPARHAARIDPVEAIRSE